MPKNESQTSPGDESPLVPITETATPHQAEVDRTKTSGSRHGDTESAQAIPPRRRRRVARACDNCRRQKIKCTGQQPCEHCTMYDSECTFDRPSNRRRNPTSQEIQALQQKLQRAESLLRKLMPSRDRPDADLDSILDLEPPKTDISEQAEVDSRSETEGEQFITLVERIGQVGLGDDGEWDFRGLSSGAAHFSRILNDVPELQSYDPRTPFFPQAPRPYIILPLGFPTHAATSGAADRSYQKLPSRSLARMLCEYSFNCATCVLRTVHVPSFYRMFDGIYDMPSQSYTSEQRRFLGLLFAVLALGSMYDVDENDPSNPNHYAVAMDRGFNYYISARLYLEDLTECGDIMTLQALVFISQFLQATANLSGCHTFVGIAIRSALRMGLHRRLTHIRMTPIEDETRRRVFHVIRQMDIYLSTTLGLPLLLRDKDIDQPLPTEVDDEYITEHGIHNPPPGTPCFFQAFNAHANLMQILAKVVEHLYPPNGIGEASSVTYMISHDRIKEIEQDLRSWSDELPTAWRPGPDGNTQVIRVRALLRFAYAHVQMMLYRPFLGFSRYQSSTNRMSYRSSYAYQIIGINVCRNIVNIGLEIRKQNVLLGPHWFILYTQFLAVLTLVVYVLDNPDNPASSEILRDAELGKGGICGLAQRSLPADRVSAALNSLFEKLRTRLHPNTMTLDSSEKSPLNLGIPGTHPAPPGLQVDDSVSPAEPIGLADMLALSDSKRVSDTNLGPAARTPGPSGPDNASAQQQTWSHESPHVQFPPDGFVMNAITFPPEDPFAYPLLNDFGAIAQPTHNAGMDENLAEVQLFPYQYSVIEGELSTVRGYLSDSRE